MQSYFSKEPTAMKEERQPLIERGNADNTPRSYEGTCSDRQNQARVTSSETSTSDPTLKLKIVLKNIAISVGKITVNSQYAKQVVFILSKQDGEPLPEYHQSIADSSVENVVAKDFSGYEASSVQIHFIPFDKEKRVSIKYFEIKEHNANGVPIPSLDQSDQEVNVKVFEEDREVEFPVRKITVTSKHAKEIVCALKPNNEKLSKSMASNPKKETHEEVHFHGEMASDVNIRLIQYENSTNTSVKRIKMEIGKMDKTEGKMDKIEGSTLLVVLGVVIVAIVVSIMTIHWAKIIYEECYSDRMVYLLLIVLSALGLISGFFLISLRFKRKTKLCVFSISNQTTGMTFMKIKLVFMFIFGICYLFHCGLYVWKNTFENKCFGNNDFSFAYNVISIFYTCTLFVYFSLFYGKRDNTFFENLASLFIMVTNACIWLDALFSESGKVFKDEINVTESTTVLDITNHSSRATETISITESFLSPASIEFSLLSIDMLFTRTSPTSNNKKINEDTNLKKELAIKRIFQIIFSLIAIALFAFTLVVVLTNDESTELPDYPDDFKFYVYYQVGIKGLMFILIMCLLVELPRLTFHVNVSTFVLLVACFGNVIYHFLYCIALGSKDNKPFNCTLILSLLENICGILLALFQSVFIIGTHMPKNYAKHSDESRVQKCKDWLHKNVAYYACCLLGILNLGLWVSDSVGELRLPVFSITIYKAFGTRGWSIINKIILPLTIFFRFHTAFDFLEYYWKHDTMIDNELEHTQQGNNDQNHC